MGDHDLVGDGAPDTAPPNIVEAKVIASSLVGLVGSVTVAVLNAVAARPDLLGGLPPWLQFLLLAAIPPILIFAGGYAKTSNRV